MSKYNLEEHLDDLIKKLFSKMAVLPKNGVWLGAFLTEVDFISSSEFGKY